MLKNFLVTITIPYAAPGEMYVERFIMPGYNKAAVDYRVRVLMGEVFEKHPETLLAIRQSVASDLA